MDSTGKIILGILGLLLIGVGVTGDVVAGMAVLANQFLQGFALHLAAVLLWILGLNSLAALSGLRDGRLTAAVMLGALLFPGLGTLGYTLGSGLAHFLGRHGPRAAQLQEESVPPPDVLTEVRAAVSASPDSLIEMEIRPLVEILASPDPGAKRAALDRICRKPGAQALSLARALLADPDADVRALAAVAVSRLETDFNERLRAARERQESQPEAAEHHAETGALYYEYAQAETGDSTNRRLYLAQARKSLERAASLDTSQPDLLLSLVEVLTELGEEHEAAEVVVEVIAANPTDARGYLLGMQIAFQRGRFDEVSALARRARRKLAENDEALPLMQWWSGFSPRSSAGIRDG